VKVKVYRKDPSVDEQAYFKEYDVPVKKEEKWTVMDVLDYISRNLDGSLSYYRHSACCQGICARCVVKVNGKPALACARTVVEDELILEPSREDKLVKDLVIQV